MRARLSCGRAEAELLLPHGHSPGKGSYFYKFLSVLNELPLPNFNKMPHFSCNH